MTYERIKGFDFSKSSLTDYRAALYSYPRPEPDVWGIIKPFTLEVPILDAFVTY